MSEISLEKNSSFLGYGLPVCLNLPKKNEIHSVLGGKKCGK